MPVTAPIDHASASAALRRGWIWVVLAVGLAALDLSRHLFENWMPHDEGALALAGALVRGGAWPHRDFADIYTGGLAFLDAAAQQLLGDDLRSLRLPFAAATLGWVALLAACLRRWVTAPAAAGLALLAYLWGPPLYAAAMPTWYLLFLATGVLWTLLRAEESEDPRWWGLAGALIGAGLLLKVNAIFLVAACGGPLLLRAASIPTPETGGGRRPAGAALGLVLLIGTLAAVLLLVSGWGWTRALTISLPILVLALTAADRLGRAAGNARECLARVAAPAAWAAGGLLFVVLPWILTYAALGALPQLVEGVLVVPFRRMASARMSPPPFFWTAALATAAMIALWHLRLGRRASLGMAALILGLAAWGIMRGRGNSVPVIIGTWNALRLIAPAGLVVGAIHWARARRPEAARLVVPLWVAAWFALVQYPFAAPIYFAYAAPLLLVALAALTATLQTPRPPMLALCVALAAWTLGVSHGQSIDQLGWRAHPRPLYATLGGPRGGLEVPIWEALAYGDLTELLDRWGATRIVAGPDAPEVYYLAGRALPDREFFEFMAPEWSAAVLARRIAEHHAQAAVLNTRPGFSRVSLDSVVALLPAPPLVDTVIGRFRVLRLPAADASP